MSFSVPQNIVDLAQKLPDVSGPIAREYFRGALDIIDKADESPVTIADKTAELEMRKVIEATFPDHGIFGEEFGIKDTDGPFEWVLDPVDGTRAFISGLPTWGTLIGLRYHGEPVIGVIDQP